MGDGMQCPPSPLLFDPSLTLEDHSVKEVAEGSVDVLASEKCQPGFLLASGRGVASQVD